MHPHNTHSKNTQMADKLKKAGFKSKHYDQKQPDRFSNNNKVYPPLTSWKGDGEDHINIWKNGKTELGRGLSPQSRYPLKHHIFGEFSSMSNFWSYLNSVERDDRVRNMPPAVLANFSKQLTQQRVVNFFAIIMDAHYQRIKQNKDLHDRLKRCPVPLDMYTVDSETGLPRRAANFSWLLDGFEEIRNALEENRAPDFTFLMDDKENPLYHHELARFKHFMQNDEEPGLASETTKKTPVKPARVPVLTTDRSIAEALLTFNELEVKLVKVGNAEDTLEDEVYLNAYVNPDQENFYLRAIDLIATKGVTHINGNKREFRFVMPIANPSEIFSVDQIIDLESLGFDFHDEDGVPEINLSVFLSKVEISIAEQGETENEIAEKIVARFGNDISLTALPADADGDQLNRHDKLVEILGPVLQKAKFSVGRIGITLLEQETQEKLAVEEVQAQQPRVEVSEEPRIQSAALLQPKPQVETGSEQADSEVVVQQA